MKNVDYAIKKETVLVVDDSVDNLLLISNLLKALYTVKVANGGEKALRFIESGKPPDLILLDIIMQDVTGYEVIEKLKANPKTHNIPVIFLTAKTSAKDETYGLSLGASDYISKPITPAILLARVKTQLQNKLVADFLEDKNSFLEREVAKRTQELEAIQKVTIHMMASLAETRDNATGGHIRRTQKYVKILAQELQKHPKFAHFLSDSMIETLYNCAPLHDIGKVGIPDAILLKPGKFTPEEFEIMKMHTQLGKNAIEKAELQLGYKVDFLKIAKEIAHFHQEKYDGSGYPLGLVGEAIPIAARLMAVADVYDALISKRVYKSEMSHEAASEIILQGRGTNFDPDIVDAFMAQSDAFGAIAQEFQDA